MHRGTRGHPLKLFYLVHAHCFPIRLWNRLPASIYCIGCEHSNVQKVIKASVLFVRNVRKYLILMLITVHCD